MRWSLTASRRKALNEWVLVRLDSHGLRGLAQRTKEKAGGPMIPDGARLWQSPVAGVCTRPLTKLAPC